MDYIYSVNNLKINQSRIKWYDTKYALILTTEKVASTYLLHYFKDYIITAENDEYNESIDIPNLTFEWDITKSKAGKWTIQHDSNLKDDDFLDKKNKTIDLFLKGKLKKDVIILIRNPWERFVSGFLQDYLKPIYTNPITFFFIGTTILDKDEDTSMYDWWIKNKSIIENVSNDNEWPEDIIFVKCLNYIFKNIIKQWFESGSNVFFGHNSPYHIKLLHLLFNIKNRDTIKIFDIDTADLDTIFGKYFPGGKIMGKKHVTGRYKDILNSVFKNNDEDLKQIKEHIVNKIQLEGSAYATLKLIEKTENK